VILLVDDAGGLSPIKKDKCKSAKNTGCQACLPLFTDGTVSEQELYIPEKADDLGFPPWAGFKPLVQGRQVCRREVNGGQLL